SDIYLRCPNHFRPTDANGKEMGIAERNIGDGNVRSDRVRFGHFDGLIGKSRAPDEPQGLVSNCQTVADAKPVADSLKRIALAGLCTLTVADVQRSRFLVSSR